MAMRLVTEGESAVAEQEPAPQTLPEPATELKTAEPREAHVPITEPAAERSPAQAPAVSAAPPEPLTMTETVRQITEAFEEERRHWQASQEPRRPKDALERATERAQNALAEEIFREEEGDEDLYGIGPQGLSKLERDALIGQGIDFQSRGDVPNALLCYEKAIAGGLRLPAAYFTLGLLYQQQGRLRRARAAFARAGKDDHSFREGILLAMKKARV